MCSSALRPSAVGALYLDTYFEASVCAETSDSSFLFCSPQSEEDKQLKEDLEMCVERLTVCFVFTMPCGCDQYISVVLL